MYRYGPCIPTFRRVFLIKSTKKSVYVIMLFLVLVLIKNVFFGFKKDIRR